MSLRALDAFWAEFLSGADPIAHELRSRYPERWVRFHTLPESKRYPDTEAELSTILDRHNAILSGMIEPGDPLFLVTVAYSGASPGIAAERAPSLVAADPGAEPWRSVLLDGEPDDEPSYAHVFVSTTTWTPGVFDPVLRLVVNDEASGVLIVCPDRRRIYHPYDGGADVILESPASRDRVRNRFADWLSTRADGL